MVANSPNVTQAIYAALDDINLLRALVYAQTPDAANAILTAYDSKLTLSGGDVQLFFELLKRGHVTITVAELVQYYDGLQPPKRSLNVRGKEWVL